MILNNTNFNMYRSTLHFSWRTSIHLS